MARLKIKENDTWNYAGYGEQGATGYSGYTGYTGYSGYTGETGYTGYTGYTGLGPTGYTGYTGAQGEAADQGATGYTGYTGTQGDVGATGYTGYTGENGAQGTTGYTGYTGEFPLTLTENDPIIMDSTLSADGKYTGIIISGTAGATLVFGDLCYLNNDDSRWELTDANLSDGYDKLLGMCVLAAASNGSSTKMLLIGTIRADAAFPTLTAGAPVYMSETAGDIVTTAPTTTDVCIRVIGHGIDGNTLYFNPDNIYTTHL